MSGRRASKHVLLTARERRMSVIGGAHPLSKLLYIGYKSYRHIYIYIERERERERESITTVQACPGLKTFTPNFRPTWGFFKACVYVCVCELCLCAPLLCVWGGGECPCGYF